MSDSLPPHGLYSPWNSPGQNTGVVSSSLLQRIFPTQGSNPGLPHCRHTFYCLSHHGSPFSNMNVDIFLSFLPLYHLPFSPCLILTQLLLSSFSPSLFFSLYPFPYLPSFLPSFSSAGIYWAPTMC